MTLDGLRDDSRWMITLSWLASGALVLGACSDPSPGEADAGSVSYYSVVSADGFLHPPAPACTGDMWNDFGCDGNIPLGCSEYGERIDYDPDDDTPCPICVAPADSDPTTCGAWKAHYGAFLADIVSASCANWCATSSDCFAWEIANACGTYALSLFGGIDEEPILFAEEFAADNCGACGEREQVVSMDGALLTDYEPACIEHQCVLVRSD